LAAIAGQLFFNGRKAHRAVTGLDALQHLGFGKGLRLRELTKQMEMIGHQGVGQHPHPAESLQAAHQPDKSRCFKGALRGGIENEAAIDHPGDAVVKAMTWRLDPRKTHELGARQ